MALIKCYECEKEISDQAPACPHCGAPKEEQPPQIEEAEIPEGVAVVDEPEPITQETVSAPTTEPEPLAEKGERFNQGVAIPGAPMINELPEALTTMGFSLKDAVKLPGVVVLGYFVARRLGDGSMSTPFVFALVVVLLIFIALPVVIRFRAARPLSKRRAFGIAAGLYVLFSVLLMMGESSYEAQNDSYFIVLLAWAAYAILRIGGSRMGAPKADQNLDLAVSPTPVDMGLEEPSIEVDVPLKVGNVESAEGPSATQDAYAPPPDWERRLLNGILGLLLLLLTVAILSLRAE
jgi:hypothetical protein